MTHAESKTNKRSLSPDEAALVDSAGQGTSFDFAAILDSIPSALICIDQHWRCSYVNAQAEHIFRRKREELLGRDVWEVWLAKIGSTFYQKAHEVVEKQASLEYTEYHDLLQQWLAVRISPARDGITVFLQIVTERKRLEAELHTAKEQLEVILYNVDDGIMVQDVTGKIIYANLAAARVAGCASVEELLQAPLLAYLERLDITGEQGHPLSAALLPGRRAIQGETSAQLTIRFVNKETQEVRWARLKSTAIAATDHVPALVITVIQDITQFKELEQRKDGFIMNVSHELRTPLAALNGYLELLKEFDERLDPPTKSMFLQRAMENGNVLTRLINSILDALQISNAIQPAQREALSVAQTVREVLAQFDPQKKQAYALQMQIPEQLKVWADQHALQQVLRNLLSNAFKYAPPQTPIILSAVRREETQRPDPAAYVCIFVQDAGPGIPLSEQPLLFQKFMRLKRDLSGTVRGTGLGLYISKQLIEAMGGDMWVESSGHHGEGSRFCFTLLEASHVPL